MDKIRTPNPYDGIRALAIIWVSLLYRYALLLGWPFHTDSNILHTLVWDGYLMVEVFFFLAGYFSYAKYQEKIQRGEVDFGGYFFKKVVKFFPLMILTAIVATGVQVAGKLLMDDPGFSNTISISGLILSCLGLQSGYFNDGGLYSNPTAWYLCILLVDYVIFFALCRIRNDTLKRCAFLLWTLIGCAIMLKPLNWFLAYESSGRGYFAFGFGCMVSHLYRTRGMNGKNLRILLSGTAFFLVAATWIFWPNYIGNKNIVMVTILCPAALVLSTEWNGLRRGMSCRLFRAISAHSYGIYLWSFPIDICIYIAISGDRGKAANAGIWTISCFVILMWSYLYDKFLAQRVQRLFVETAQKLLG